MLSLRGVALWASILVPSVASAVQTHTTQSDFAGGSGGDVNATPGAVQLLQTPGWRLSGWAYRRAITAVFELGSATDFPLELSLRLAQDVAGLGALDPQSVRIIESDGSPAGLERASHFEPGVGSVDYAVLTMNGTTSLGVARRYEVYFDSLIHGSKPAPSYRVSVNSSSMTNGVMDFQSIGQNASSGSAPLAVGLLHYAPTGELVHRVRDVKVTSSDGDYGSEAMPAGYGATLAANTVTAVSGPTLLVDQPDLRVNRTVAQANNLRLTLFVVLTTGARARTTILVENQASVTVIGLKYIHAGDYDLVNPVPGDLGSYVPADDLLLLSDSGGPLMLGLRGVLPSSRHEVDDRINVFTDSGTGSLSNASSFGPGDVGGALQYEIGSPLLPGDRFLFQDSWGVSIAGYPDLRAQTVSFSIPPILSIDAAEGQYVTGATFTSTVMDTGSPQAAWTLLEWNANLPARTSLQMQVRTGPTPVPDASWTAWSATSAVSPLTIPNPAGIYLQYQAQLATSDPGVTPQLLDVTALTNVPLTSTPLTNAPLALEVGCACRVVPASDLTLLAGALLLGLRRRAAEK